MACLWLAMCATMSAASASPNLIVQGSFETGVPGWPQAISPWTSRSGGTLLECSNATGSYGIPTPPDGVNFCEVEYDPLSPTSTPDWLEQTVSTTSGETYIVSAQAVSRVNTSSQDRMILNAAGTNIGSFTLSTVWSNYSGSFTASAASSVIRYVSDGSVSGSFAQPGDASGLMVDVAQVQELTVSPAAQTLPEDGSLVLSSATGKAFQVADNSTTATLTAAFSVTRGRLTLASTTGLTFTSGSNNSASFTVSGTAAAINTALNAGITYAQSTADYNGSDTITFTATAGSATDTDTVALTITPVADITNDTVTVAQDGSITFNAITGTNGATADSFENIPTAVSASTPSRGTATPSSSVPGQITYTPNAGYFGSDSFTYTVTSGGVTETATVTINVTPAQPRLRLTKVSNGGVSSFTFTGSNGWTSQTITTGTAGVGANGTAQFLTTAGVATTITEALNSSYFINSATCTDANSANTGKTGSFGTLAGYTLTIPAGNVVLGAQVNCTFTNTRATPSLSILKTANTAGPVAVNNVITYTFVVTNTGNVPVSNIVVNDVRNGSGSFVGINGETLQTDAAPAGDSTDGTANNGTWTTLGVGDAVRFTATYTVSQNDIDTLQ